MSKNKLNRKWEVLLVHHSHTDIGYTHSQEIIEFYHVNFIKQAIEIAESLRADNRENEFVWVCEAFWAVEQFLKEVDDEWKKRFEVCVKNGSIEVTGNYLNMTELVDEKILKNQIKKSVDYGKSINKEIKSAMTADINGYSYGYIDALKENGIENLLSCVHTHHGMYPLFRKHGPFYWESEKGNKILVWNGEHYQFGNEFGIVKTATASYVHRDDLQATFTQDKRKEYGEIRMFRFLKSLEDQNYEYNFIPITILGISTDNGSPNKEIVDFVNWWNEKFGEEVTFKMATLDEVFDRVKNDNAEIPTYSGDWPDWWSFGVGSTPHDLKIYKEAQRVLNTTKLLDEDSKISDDKLVSQCEDMLMLYAEHTWGHYSSVVDPWNSFVNLLDCKKSGYAIKAHEVAMRNYIKVLEAKGMNSLKPDRPLKYKVVNPHNRKVTECVKLALDPWEKSNKTYVVKDENNNKYKSQFEEHPGGICVNCVLTLEPKEERTLFINIEENPIEYLKIKNQSYCVQRCDDIFLYDDPREVIKYDNVYENKHVKISWDRERGIIGWFDKVNGVELFDNTSKVGAFMPIYELTKAKGQTTSDQFAVRALGRNMRGSNHEVFYPKIKDVKISEIGDVYGKITFDLELEGIKVIRVVLKVYNEMNKVDVVVMMNKESEWNPESVFIALPFALNNKKMDLFCEKTGAVIQVKKDQLLGTNCDYNLVQDGVGLLEDSYGISISMPDSSLIYTSKLQYENAKKLYHKDYTNPKEYELYSWVMNNIWETNFKASLGGFIEFNYSVTWENNINNKYELASDNNEMNIGFVNYRID
ncbi:hypothetical protein [Clostridium sp.]|uniref:glycoside hydrolase family 38 N-terminal domain-containing protein n=1 Tax=Clostridium sp. TaxID=1506 RepID=UPI00263552A0|nr:hypothetical protein [Clostridium sp.]